MHPTAPCSNNLDTGPSPATDPAITTSFFQNSLETGAAGTGNRGVSLPSLPAIADYNMSSS